MQSLTQSWEWKQSQQDSQKQLIWFQVHRNKVAKMHNRKCKQKASVQNWNEQSQIVKSTSEQIFDKDLEEKFPLQKHQAMPHNQRTWTELTLKFYAISESKYWINS